MFLEFALMKLWGFTKGGKCGRMRGSFYYLSWGLGG